MTIRRGGIYVKYSSNNNLTDNTANYNTQYGILIQGSFMFGLSDNNTLTENTANNNTQNGIYLQSSSNNNLTDNTACYNDNYDNIHLTVDSNNNSGENTLCTVTDEDANSVTCLTLCPMPPQISLNLPDNGAQVNNTQEVDFNFTATDVNDLTLSCDIYLDDVLNQTNASTKNNTLTDFTIGKISYDGSYNWYVNCTDGSLDNVSETRTFSINDTIAPQIELNLPIANASYFNELDFDFNFTETDNVDTTANCSIYLDGALNQSNATTANDTLTNFLITAIGYGYHNWSIGCIDSSDNENMTANRTLNLTRRIIPPTGGAGGTSPATAGTIASIPPGASRDVSLNFGNTVSFTSGGASHSIRVSGIFDSTAELTIQSSPIKATFKVGNTKQFDTNANGLKDLEITLLSKTNTTVDLRIKVLSEAAAPTPSAAAVCSNSVCESGETAANCPADCAKAAAYTSPTAMFFSQKGSLLMLAIIIIVAAVIYVGIKESGYERKKKIIA